jgi:hypothetical protein
LTKCRARELIKTCEAGEPVLKLILSVGTGTMWPAVLEHEADRAASMLRPTLYTQP